MAPGTPPGRVRNKLARLLIRGDAVDRAVRTLSGGERFRVALARPLLADPPPQLLILDEPTNNLDTQTVDQLVAPCAVTATPCSWSATTTRSSTGSTSPPG